ncbi:MAG: alpha/beta hydrolase [Verrucomicrobiota bacterium]
MIRLLSRYFLVSACALFGVLAEAGDLQWTELPDGRTLSYREIGNPQGPLVFYFHGLPGSHREASLIEEEICRAGLRVVAVDRPGMAQSTFQPRRKIFDWTRDMEFLANHLGYENKKFGILAVSGGTPYACACALAMGHRISHLALVTPFAPRKAEGVEKSSLDFLLQTAARHPNLAKLVLSSQNRQLERNPDKAAERGMRPFLPEEQEFVLGQPEVKQDFIANLEQIAYQGPRGVVTEIRLLAKPWDIDVSEIRGVKVSLWAGGRDEIAPESMAKYFWQQIEGSRLFIDPETGHLSTLKEQAGRILSKF